jgi:hypothetical protein
MIKKKILFLDVDGVLNCSDWYQERYDKVRAGQIVREHPVDEFSPSIVAKLNKITDATGAEIVISSTWRLGRSLDELRALFTEVGITAHVLDKTPFFGSIDGYTIPRGCEIEAWLDEHKFQRINWSLKRQKEFAELSEVDNYVIFDDDSDMLYNQREHFIKTSQKTGLSDCDVDIAIELLKKPIWELYYEIDAPFYDENIYKEAE